MVSQLTQRTTVEQSQIHTAADVQIEKLKANQIIFSFVISKCEFYFKQETADFLFDFMFYKGGTNAFGRGVTCGPWCLFPG